MRGTAKRFCERYIETNDTESLFLDALCEILTPEQELDVILTQEFGAGNAVLLNNENLTMGEAWKIMQNHKYFQPLWIEGLSIMHRNQKYLWPTDRRALSFVLSHHQTSDLFEGLIADEFYWPESLKHYERPDSLCLLYPYWFEPVNGMAWKRLKYISELNFNYGY